MYTHSLQLSVTLPVQMVVNVHLLENVFVLLNGLDHDVKNVCYYLLLLLLLILYFCVCMYVYIQQDCGGVWVCACVCIRGWSGPRCTKRML